MIVALFIMLGACAPQPRTEGPPSLVLVSLDTFRADRVGALGGPVGLTPNLDAFAAESTVFEAAYSQAVQTTPSHTSVFTSRYPSETTGADGDPYVPPETPLLAQLLKLYGFQTGAFVGGGDLSEARGLSGGFDRYTQGPDFGSLWHTTPPALAWLDERDAAKPYFLFVHGYDAHSPYLKPPPYGYLRADAAAAGPGQEAVRSATERIVDGVMYQGFWVLMHGYAERLRPRSAEGRAWTAREGAADGEPTQVVSEADIALVRGVYDGGVAYADAQFGRLMAGLQARGALDEAWIVVMADHGEQLGERGIFGHCCDTGDEETHVPLLVRAPGGAGGGQRVRGIVELVDVMPTLLAIVGATPPAGIHGVSLLDAARGAPFAGRAYAYTEGSETMRTLSMRGAAGRLTWTGLPATAPQLPALLRAVRVDGPSFTADAALPVATRAQMRDAMVEWVRALAPPPTGAVSRPPRPAALDAALRAHGYWDAAP
jgi:arylsulfatase A-like enzyme